jgi:hypothetical protein
MIDGLHRMRDADGEEDLKWLPLQFPGNVRLIVSSTIYPDSAPAGQEGHLVRKNKTLTELRRRQWDMLEIKEMTNKCRKDVLTSYLKVSLDLARPMSSSAAQENRG